MEELELVKAERIALQEKYFKEAKNVWTEFEGEEAAKKHKKVYNDYVNKDKFLNVIESRLVSCIEDINFYNEKMK